MSSALAKSPPARPRAAEPHRLSPAECGADAAPDGRWSAVFGVRFAVLALAGLATLAPAWWNPRFALLMLLWDVLLLLAWAVDLARLPATVRVRRRWLGALAVGRPSALEYVLAHESEATLHVELADDLDEGLAATAPEAAFTVPAGTRVEGLVGTVEGGARVPLTPAARGDHHGRAVRLRVQSSLGLAQRRLRAELPQVVRVYPDLGDPGAITLAALRTRQMELERRRQRLAGVRREFEALRDWRDGDELRDVCWPATARRNRLVSKQWRAERSQTVWLVVDAGRLMGARVGERSRLDVAADAALRLARVAEAAGDRVGLLVYGRRVQQRLAPGHGRAHRRALLDALALAARETSEADHMGAALQVLARQKQRALVVWITDVAETAGTPDVIEGARQVARRHLLLFLALAHRELADAAAAPPDDLDTMWRRAAALELSTRREALLRALRQRGARVAEAEPGALATVAINGYLEAKERSRL